MKRFHVHLGVRDVAQSVAFYSMLFGTPPAVRKDDYAKWMLDDPRVNFAISTRGAEGLDHLGLQVESEAELAAAATGLAAAGQSVTLQDDAVCCYARSDKAWIADPQGIAWETFFSRGEVVVYGEDGGENRKAAAAQGACCAPPSPAPGASVGKPAASCCG